MGGSMLIDLSVTMRSPSLEIRREAPLISIARLRIINARSRLLIRDVTSRFPRQIIINVAREAMSNDTKRES